MAEATLVVTRLEPDGLLLVLQSAHRDSPMRDTTHTDAKWHRKLKKSLRKFRECLVGFHQDERKLAVIGQELFRDIVPPAMRAEIRKLRVSLEVQTDETSIPWEILHDGDDFLATRLALSRKTFRTTYAAAIHGTKPGKLVLVIADPTGDLPGARAEGTAIKELFGPDCDLLMHDDATCENVREYLITQYAIIHYCGHVVYSARLGTSLRLRDGNLSADEVADVLRGQPVVFLNGCLTDRRRDPSLREVSRAPEQHEGLADGFITGNELAAARAVIGTMWRVPDEPLDAGRDFTLCFYQKLLGGVAIGEALRCSRVMARDKKWGPMVWSPYTLYGDPLFAPFPAVTQPAQSAAADQAALRRPDQKMADPSEPNAADAEGWPVGSQQASPLPPSLGISGHPVPGEMRIQGWMGRAGRRALNSPYFLIGRYSYLLAGLRVIGWPAMPASECGAPHGPVVEQKTEGPLVTESGTGRAIPTAGDKRLENGRLVKSPISVGLLLKVVTAALLYLIYNSSEATRRSSDSLADALMRNSGTAEREQAARDERMQQGDKAWVVIGTVILDEPLALGKRPAAVLTIKNTGRSPAEHVTVAGDLLSSRGHPKRVRDRAKFDMRIYPGADWPLHFPASASLRNQEEIEAIMSGSRQLYLMGSIVYGDKFNKEQSDSFCYTTSGGQLSAGLKMSACPSGNGPY